MQNSLFPYKQDYYFLFITEQNVTFKFVTYMDYNSDQNELFQYTRISVLSENIQKMFYCTF